jgi:hypothetical protein
MQDLTQDHKEVLKFVLENINPNDPSLKITIKDLRQIDKICSIIESAQDTINLEDSDYEYLKRKFETFNNWNPLMRKIVIEVANKIV